MKRSYKIFSILLLFALLVGCVPQTPAPTAAPTITTTALAVDNDGFRWWNETVFYEIFVRSFKDSDGDGVGDFNGITEKLDYLHDLGVKGIWLMPINPSPSYHGYDATDYYAVNPDYGTMEDFKRLFEEAHKRDIKVIMDLVLNHSSSQHPWFQSALTPGSEEYERYVWRETDPGTPGPWGAPAWYRAGNGLYDYAIFWDQMPDLNYDTPEVRDEGKKMASFWLEEVGVDGFNLKSVDMEKIEDELAYPRAERLWYVADAFGVGMSLEEVHRCTRIDPWFLAQIKDLVDTELAIEKRSLADFAPGELRDRFMELAGRGKEKRPG